ncbi:MAG TPA: sigma-70 family RNA polymerase sigma factor [Phycisphaerales bacterium]|nr:sigma-70 family RNA polymerase sigma factor [Phycisphaerales bacterium]
MAYMVDNADFTDLVTRAQGGEGDSRDRLAALARDRLYAYVQRLTLRHELTEDIVQESMIEMLRFLDKLERADRFWPWLRRIAINKLHHHYAHERGRRAMSTADMEQVLASDKSREGFAELVTNELKQIIVETMGELKPRYREVLVLRCYEQMDYASIAEEMGTTEFSTRVLFFRAKNALAKQLARRGLGRASLAMVLVVFGRMTAESQAAAATVQVGGGTLAVGATAAAAGALTTKTAMVTLAAAAVVAGTALVQSPKSALHPGAPSGASSVALTGLPAGATAAHSCWYFYPEGAGGPVMIRRAAPSGGGAEPCRYLQNDRGNYYFDTRAGVVYINNHHDWDADLYVRRLPTDDADLRDFLSRVQPDAKGPTPVSDAGPGLLVIGHERAEWPSWTTRHVNMLNEDYYRCDWPKDVRVVDRRDDLHRRGYADFRVRGHVGSEDVFGRGQIPLVYAERELYQPWLWLQVGSRLVVADGPEGAYRYEAGPRRQTVYPSGCFFAGLSRPWMGLHAIDTVRRDAAAARVWFSTRLSEDGRLGQVELQHEDGSITYTIDMDSDLVTEVVFEGLVSGSPVRGRLSFEYVLSVAPVADAISVRPLRRVRDDALPHVAWVFDLAR